MREPPVLSCAEAESREPRQRPRSLWSSDHLDAHSEILGKGGTSRRSSGTVAVSAGCHRSYSKQYLVNEHISEQNLVVAWWGVI